MTDENVVPFPRPPLDAANAPRRIIPGKTLDEAEPVTRCEDIFHVYAEVPGRCQCGERWWDGNTETSA